MVYYFTKKFPFASLNSALQINEPRGFRVYYYVDVIFLNTYHCRNTVIARVLYTMCINLLLILLVRRSDQKEAYIQDIHLQRCRPGSVVGYEHVSLQMIIYSIIN